MKPKLHPDAANNFNEKAQVLLAAVAPDPEQGPAELPTHIFRPGGHISAAFDEGDYGAFRITGQSDGLGRTIARYFDEHEGRLLGLRTKNTKNWPGSQRLYRRPRHYGTLSAKSGSRTRSSNG